ncbi:MAG: poly-gamma-glutamate biosynthesis protein PgsC/CapC, partial [Gammaproteobacteria bacterium]|nr:poly-gamma-glutamate biosynthesis protein PgsC/CapC [Gammaproteobacteria bacterium]
MELPVIALFPHGALDSAVITTVWVGVAVVVFFNLRLGWVLSGLVVPGYMVPLLILKPWSAAVVFLEGFVTYVLVWWFSEGLSRFGYWSSLFGRDRFFALVLVSVVVRLVFDGWLLPGIGQWMSNELGLVFDYRNNLHSFGLVIIALIANQFWKTGLLRGLVPMTVTIGVTFVIVRYGLMNVTNFTISSMDYMYEDIASSILASPKAYVILLTVAFVASRMNLIYGWDFSGILIPSLLALQWYQPGQVLLTFFEAILILVIARLLLQTPWLRNTSIEGAKKLLLFFNINFIYKLLLAYLLLIFYPEYKVTDSYAFGYLLATLIA